MSNERLAEALGTTAAAIGVRARRLGIRKDPEYLRQLAKERTRGRRRSPETRARISAARRSKGRPPDEELARTYPFTTNADLAARFGVARITVSRWARQLGLRKDPAHWSRVQRERSLGRIFSAETRSRLSAKAKGRVISRQTIEKALRTKLERGTLLKGERHPRWKGGRPWERFRRPEYLRWRQAVLDRDRYRCQDCGRQCRKHEKGLAAHHLRSYKDHPDLRYDVANGLTLCRDCHNARHGNQRKAIAIKPCACGCGTLIPAEDPYGRPRRFVRFHHARGRRRSAAELAKWRTHCVGRPLSIEHRRKISQGLRESSKRVGRPPRDMRGERVF